MDNNESLAHTKWDCTYHIVWIPKYRRKVLYGECRQEVRDTLAMLVRAKDGLEIVCGSVCPDHIHMCLRIAPKHLSQQGDGVSEAPGRPGASRPPFRVEKDHRQGQDVLVERVLREHGRH